MDEVFGFVYLALLIFMLFFEVFRKKDFGIDALSFFHFYFALAYVIPGVFWCFTYEYGVWYKYYFEFNAAALPVVVGTILLSYMVIVTSFYFFYRVRFSYRLDIKRVRSTDAYFHVYAVFLLLMIVISAISAGGIIEYIVKAVSHRHREASYGIGTYLKYFIFPTGLFVVGYYALIRQYKGSVKPFMTVFFMIYLLGTLIFLVSTGGRSNILNLAVLFFLFYIMRKRKINLKVVFWGILIVFFTGLIMTYYRELTFALGKGREANISDEMPSLFDMLINIFSYYRDMFYSLHFSYSDPDFYNSPRLGLDAIRVFYSIIPGVSIEDLDLFHVKSIPDILNMHMFHGGPGYIPPGWVSLAIMNGGVPWLFFKCVFLGFTGAFISKNKAANITDPVVLFGYFSVFFIWHRFMFMGAPLNIGQNSLGFYFFIICLFFFYRIRLEKLDKAI